MGIFGTTDVTPLAKSLLIYAAGCSRVVNSPISGLGGRTSEWIPFLGTN